MLVAQSCLAFCDHMDCSPSGSSVHGISLARILEWVAVFFSRDLPNPGIEPSLLHCSLLPLRIERHVENALKVVDYLAKNPKVAKVNHPSLTDHPDHELYKKYFPNGGGSIFTFEVNGTQEDTWKFIDSLQIFSLLANVADVKSLVIHPYTTTHSQMTSKELAEQHITPTTVRLSIGVEHVDDIIADLDQAFAKI